MISELWFCSLKGGSATDRLAERGNSGAVRTATSGALLCGQCVTGPTDRE